MATKPFVSAAIGFLLFAALSLTFLDSRIRVAGERSVQKDYHELVFADLQKAKLLGRTDVSFGTVCSLAGEWHFDESNRKRPTWQFCVSTVNGEPRSKAIEFAYSDVRVRNVDKESINEGEVWSCRGYEMLAHSGVPVEAVEKKDFQGYIPSFRLTSQLILFDVVQDVKKVTP